MGTSVKIKREFNGTIGNIFIYIYRFLCLVAIAAVAVLPFPIVALYYIKGHKNKQPSNKPRNTNK